ncbi:hypothetical protein D3C87_1346110 [compost metagenome]
MVGGAEALAPVQQRHAPGHLAQRERPVERRIAAARHDHTAAGKARGVAHGVVQMPVFERGGLGQRHALRREGPGAGADQHCRHVEAFAGVGGDQQARMAVRAGVLADAVGPLAEVHRERERCALLHEPVYEVLRQAAWHGRNVVDRLLRVQLGALAAGPVEHVDQLAFEPQHAGLERGEQANRPGADDQHIGLRGFLGGERGGRGGRGRHDRGRCAAGARWRAAHGGAEQGPIIPCVPWESGHATVGGRAKRPCQE